MKYLSSLFICIFFMIMLMEPIEQQPEPAPCTVIGYELIGNGYAVTNCGDTIRKKHYSPYGNN